MKRKRDTHEEHEIYRGRVEEAEMGFLLLHVKHVNITSIKNSLRSVLCLKREF
jgi:hypothetical protein